MQAYSHNDREHLRFAASNAAEVRRPRTWLVSSKIDILFVCGLAPWLLGWLTYMVLGGIPNAPIVSESQQQLTIFFVLTSLIIGEGHQFTSIVRYYAKLRQRKKSKYILELPFYMIYFGFGSALLTMLGITLAMIPSVLFFVVIVQLAIAFFPVVLMQHLCAQAKAIGLIYCGKEGFELSAVEKHILTTATYLLVLAGGCTIAQPFGFEILAGISKDPLDANMFAQAQTVLVPAALLASGTFALMMLHRGFSTDRWLPFGAGVLWTNLVAFILLPFPPMLYVWLFVPLFFHATQHWAVAWMVHQKEEQISPNAQLKTQLLEFAKMALPIQALSLSVLFIPIFAMQFFALPTKSNDIFDINATLPVSWSMLVFYLHYFADRIVWRPQ